ncbi:MAG: DUF1254 domain-containing protein [Planctomycetota bacterium]
MRHVRPLALSLLGLLAVASASPGARAGDPALDLATFEQIAEEAYLYAYPLVLMDTTRAVSTNVATASTLRGPMNRWIHARTFPDASFTDVVRPNADTLYSSLWLDVSREPWVITVPDSKGRYYLLPFLDMWTDVFAVPGTRTTGNGPQRYALVGPNWRGRLPPGLTRIDCPTPIVWCIGRVQTNGPKDYENVHRFQDGLGLSALSCWKQGRTTRTEARVDPRIDMKTAPAAQVGNMEAGAFFAQAAQLMKVHPAHFNDQPILARMRRIGLVPGASFDASRLDEAHRAALARGTARGLERLRRYGTHMADVKDGWQGLRENMGTWGTQYLRRAAVALFGLGANVPEDAVYPTSMADPDGKPYDGNAKYVMHFDKDRIPPVNAFWSLTAYNERQAFVDNPLNRYTRGDRDALRFNEDGSLDLYLQREDPGGDESANWLPTPDGPFTLNLRLYWPKEVVLDGTWTAPPVVRAD